MVILAWRDLAVRYKQTAIGVAWALIRPGLTMLVFRRISPAGRHRTRERCRSRSSCSRPCFPGSSFPQRCPESSGSLIGNANLISKIYFPRLIIPCAAVVTSLVDFLVTLGLLALLMLWYGFVPGWQLLFLPLFVLLTLGLSVGLGLFFRGAQRRVPRFPLRGSFHRASSGCSSRRSPSPRRTCRSAGARSTP